jgi:predicted HicB family RNase H-like nuclease
MNDILQYKDYYASVHFSAEDEVCYGKILGINDLVSFEGSSVRELKKSFHEAVEDYLATCEQAGKDPDKTYKGTFNVRIPSDLHKEAAVFAAINNVSLNDFVKTAIHYALLHRHDVNNQLGAGK